MCFLYVMYGLPATHCTLQLIFNSIICLAASLSNISSNYKIGLGTFVDKPIPPYSPITSAQSDSGTCLNGVAECVPPYSYRHILSLTDDQDEFVVSFYYIKFVGC